MKIKVLNKSVIYAVTAIRFLIKKKEVVGLADMKELNIPKDFLENILAKLRRAEIIKTLRGPGGGYYFNSARHDLTLGEVMESVSLCTKLDSMENLEKFSKVLNKSIQVNVLNLKVSDL